MEFSLYPVIIGIFSAAGLLWSTFRLARGKIPARIREAEVNTSLSSAVVLLSGFLIGSRVAYAFLHWKSFEGEPLKLLQLNAGGLDWMGLALGGLIAVLIYAGFSDKNPVAILANHFHLIAFLTIGCWLGAQVTGIGYGRVVEPSWWAFPVFDRVGEIHPRFPLPAIAALFSLLIYFLIDQYLPKSSSHGLNIFIFATCQYALIYLVTFFRADTMMMVVNQPLERLAALIHVAIGFVAITSWSVYSFIQAKKKRNNGDSKQTVQFNPE